MVIWLWLLACAEPPCTSMSEGPDGLALTVAEHPTGWGEADCGACHVPDLVHRRDCTPDVDLAAVRVQVAEDGIAGCGDCHGDNGVAP